MNVVLTTKQWAEETERMYDSKIWAGVELEEALSNKKAYLKVSRIGASFRLTRPERLAIKHSLFERVQSKIKRNAQIALMDSVNFPGSQPDYEGMILSRQEAIYGE